MSLPDVKARRAERWMPLLLGGTLGLLADAAGGFAAWLPFAYEKWVMDHRAYRGAFLVAGVGSLINILTAFTVFCAGLLLVGCIFAFVRRRWALSIVRKGLLLVPVWFLLFSYVVVSITDVILVKELPWGDSKLDSVLVFMLRCRLLWPFLAGVLVVAVLYVVSWRRTTINVYTGDAETAPARGDQIIENVRTHGADPRYRKSVVSSFGLHIFVLVLLPFILNMIGCVDPYRVPWGSGKPGTGDPQVVALVKMVKPKKKPKKKYIVRHDAAILFHVPDLDESQILEKIEETTQLTYKVEPGTRTGRGGRGGKMGRGGGDQGGWPEGMKNGLVRFIRLEYKGAQWDDGMDATSGADMNFLRNFKEITGFPTANKGESHPIRLLKKYEKGYAPPFVYMTGSAGIQLSADEITILRDYMVNGGLLFADCASPSWDKSFRALAAALFPRETLRNIADDDPLFQEPYTFPNGAPPLWHHGGTRALGIKYKDRWCLFYHPGDLNDAWKTDHKNTNPELSKAAMEMGINVAYYAFTHYLELTAKDRK
jgi:hypothetical protein